jgi:hypothetical protein
VPGRPEQRRAKPGAELLGFWRTARFLTRQDTVSEWHQESRTYNVRGQLPHEIECWRYTSSIETPSNRAAFVVLNILFW